MSNLAENLAKLKAGESLAPASEVKRKHTQKKTSRTNKVRKADANKVHKKSAAKTNSKVISKPEVINKLFAHALIRNKMNASAAYRELHPKCSDKTASVEGHKSLAKPSVIAELTPLLEKLFTDAGIETEYVFRRWLEIASGSAADYFTFDSGAPVLDMSAMTPAQYANIKKISIKPGRDGTAYAIEVYCADRAVDNIAKHLGLLVEKLPEEDVERIGDMLERAVKRIRQTKDLDGWRDIVLDAEFTEVR